MMNKATKVVIKQLIEEHGMELNVNGTPCSTSWQNFLSMISWPASREELKLALSGVEFLRGFCPDDQQLLILNEKLTSALKNFSRPEYTPRRNLWGPSLSRESAREDSAATSNDGSSDEGSGLSSFPLW